MARHIHADLIHKWCEGAEIQLKNAEGQWIDISPMWDSTMEYSIKPRLVRREGWVNVYPASESKFRAYVSHAFASDCEAIVNGGSRTLATIKIEWEEEEDQ